MSRWMNMDAVIDQRLYVGNITGASSPQSLGMHKITHVLSVCKERIPADQPGSGTFHMRIPVEDVDYEDLLVYLPSACQFIDKALQNGGNVLVHCVQGLSRSAAVVAAYLMWKRRISSTEALAVVRAARNEIWPNAGFQEQLVLFELCQYAPSLSNGYYASWKAKLQGKLAAAGLR